MNSPVSLQIHPIDTSDTSDCYVRRWALNLAHDIYFPKGNVLAQPLLGSDIGIVASIHSS